MPRAVAPAHIALWLCIPFCLFVCQNAEAEAVWNARELATSSHNSVKLLDSGKEVAVVQRQQLARLVSTVDLLGRHFSISPDIVVIAGQQPNAFATRKKDGTPVVGINPAMLDLVGDDVDLLGVVVGHELAHLELRHVEDGQQRKAAINIIGIIAGAALGYKIGKAGVDPTLGLQAGSLGSLLANRKFDRDQERAADELGIRKMHVAGFDPRAAPRLWTAMRRYGSGSGLWTSTHPSHEERIGTLTQLASALAPPSEFRSTLVASAAPLQPSSELAAIASPSVLSNNPHDTSTGSTALLAIPAPAASNPVKIHAATLGAIVPKRSNEGFRELWGYADGADRWVIEPIFLEARPFDARGWAPVAVENGKFVRWGFINRNGEWEIHAQFAFAEAFDAKIVGLAEVRVGSLAFGETRFIDRNGNIKEP